MNATRGIAGVLLALLAAGCGNGTAPKTVAPPSGRIVFQSTPTGGTPELRVMVLDGSHVQTLAGGATYQSPTFSSDGARIAFSSNRDGDFSIYVMNRDGTGVARVTGPGADDDSPSWSPDGSRLVFTRFFSLGAALMVVNVDGTGETALTPVVTSGYLDWPAWSPDGTKIAYTGGGTPHIYVMNADGSGAVALPALASDTVDHPAWSPDGARLAVHDLGRGIVVMNADGSNPVSLEPGGEYGTEPAWAPDGASVVFTKYYPGGPRIARIKADGSGEVELTTGIGAVDGHPSWSH
jgi:Tol biopolymer transport system component